MRRPDEAIRELIEKSGIPYLPMSMAKGLFARHASAVSPGAARSLALKQADTVMLIGARLNWLLSHGKGKTWGATGYAKNSFRLILIPKRWIPISRLQRQSLAISNPPSQRFWMEWAPTGQPPPARMDPEPIREKVETKRCPAWRATSAKTTTCRWIFHGALGRPEKSL